MYLLTLVSPDVDAELEQLTVNAGCTPTGILPAHLPGKDGFWFDDGQRRAPVTPDTGQSNPQQAVRGDQLRAFSRGALKDADLVAQSQVLQLQGSARTKDRSQRGNQCPQTNEHRTR